MEDGFQKLFCTIAEAITFVTLLVSLGKWLTDYYLVYFVLITVSIIFGFELHKYKENEKAKKALRLLKSYGSCSNAMSMRGRTRQTIEKQRDTTPPLSARKKTPSLTETKKQKIKNKLKAPKNFNSIRRKTISNDPQKSASTLRVDFVDSSSLKRPKSLSSIVTLKKKDKTKSIPNLSMNIPQQQTIKKGVLKRSPRSLSNLLTLGTNNNKKKKETKFKLEENDNASTDSSSVEVVVKKNVTLRQKLKSKMERVIEIQKRRSLPAGFATSINDNNNNNTPNNRNPDNFNENEDLENLKKIIQVSAM